MWSHRITETKKPTSTHTGSPRNCNFQIPWHSPDTFFEFPWNFPPVKCCRFRFKRNKDYSFPAALRFLQKFLLFSSGSFVTFSPFPWQFVFLTFQDFPDFQILWQPWRSRFVEHWPRKILKDYQVLDMEPIRVLYTALLFHLTITNTVWFSTNQRSDERK